MQNPQQYLAQQKQMYAMTCYENLQRWINKFYAEKREDEYFVMLYQDASGRSIRVNQIGFQNPDLIVLAGVDVEGNKTVLLSHVFSIQLQIKFVKLSAETPDEPERRKIGFIGEAMPSTL